MIFLFSTTKDLSVMNGREIIKTLVAKPPMFTFTLDGEAFNIYKQEEDLPVSGMKLSYSGHALTFWSLKQKNMKALKFTITDIREIKGLSEFLEANRGIMNKMVILV